MPPPGAPKFRRRKAERPGEIVAAAVEVFALRGFAAAKLDEIAARAGVSKGALYLYFETKEALFAAVVREAVAPNVERVRALAEADAPFPEAARAAFGLLAATLASDRRVSAVAKVVICESRNFPELARIWHDNVVGPGVALIGGLIARAQARGEVCAGDPRLFAFGFMGPVLLGLVWRETFEPAERGAVDIRALIAQHVETMLRGLRP